jgi:hypothetical protein
MYQPMQRATYLWASVGNDRHTGITTAWPLFPLLPPYFPPLFPFKANIAEPAMLRSSYQPISQCGPNARLEWA